MNKDLIIYWLLVMWWSVIAYLIIANIGIGVYHVY